MSWKSMLELDRNRERAGGSAKALQEAIHRGADLRIYTSFRFNEHIEPGSPNRELVDEVSDFRVTYLVDDRWAGGIMTMRMPMEPPKGFGPRPSFSFFLYNENGGQAIARPYLDGAAATGQPGPNQRRDHPEMPLYHEEDRWDDGTNAPSSNFWYAFERYRFLVKDNWKEVYAHDEEGHSCRGSLAGLVEAFRSGYEMKVGVEGLCHPLGGGRLKHSVFVPCGPGYYQTEGGIFSAGTQPVVRVAPSIPLRYTSGNWDFGNLFLRTDGLVAYWRCNPYTLKFEKQEMRCAVRWFVR